MKLGCFQKKMNLKFSKNNFWLIIFIAFALMISSCKKESDYTFNKDIKIEILLSDDEGEDLFNPESFFYYNKVSIKIFYLIDGQEVEMNNERLTPPRNFFLNYVQDRHRMQLYPNHDATEEFPVTLIKWNSSETDTIKCSFDRSSSTIICNKIWLNDELVWELTSLNQNRSFEIIKTQP